MGLRARSGRLNRKAPRGLLPWWRKCRRRPVRLCKGRTLRANTQSSPRPCRMTSRINARDGRRYWPRSWRSSRCGSARCWRSMCTWKYPWLRCCSLAVSEPSWLNQSRSARFGLFARGQCCTGRQRRGTLAGWGSMVASQVVGRAGKRNSMGLVVLVLGGLAQMGRKCTSLWLWSRGYVLCKGRRMRLQQVNSRALAGFAAFVYHTQGVTHE